MTRTTTAACRDGSAAEETTIVVAPVLSAVTRPESVTEATTSSVLRKRTVGSVAFRTLARTRSVSPSCSSTVPEGVTSSATGAAGATVLVSSQAAIAPPSTRTQEEAEGVHRSIRGHSISRVRPGGGPVLATGEEGVLP